MTAEVNEPELPAPQPREVLTATRLRRWSEAALLLIGALGLICLAYPTFVLLEYLPQVDPRQVGPVYVGRPGGIDPRWIINALISGLLLILVTGLPVRRPTGTGSLPGAVAQGLGGLAVGFWALVGATILSLHLNEPCTYASCWPMHEQTAATLAPGALTAIAMIVMACLVNRLAWWIRALVPVVVWLGTVLIQHAVWTSYLLDIFQGPPR
ncbi:hypothetical protein E0H73_18870 [Kribbella pittospori]|uniref:Uncharacterized protein n=1 Tax=Kribbella pittospori TaxID=722689 RepID=A0A4R0KST7_9ACTN|nr:hypothetical protein [Kribbella pittospori]TCC61298.1 hypothetical protein E0H73_18870 [Kribbella pittospori]